MNTIIPFICGALFAVGACLSGMVRPSKVLGFLDLGGSWDATLAVVMASGLVIHAIAWRIVKQAAGPRFGQAFPPSPSSQIDLRLVGGAALFGIGWGLAGFCPGPAIVSIASGAKSSLVFAGAMAAAMLVYQQTERADG